MLRSLGPEPQLCKDRLVCSFGELVGVITKNPGRCYGLEFRGCDVFSFMNPFVLLLASLFLASEACGRLEGVRCTTGRFQGGRVSQSHLSARSHSIFHSVGMQELSCLIYGPEPSTRNPKP